MRKARVRRKGAGGKLREGMVGALWMAWEGVGDLERAWVGAGGCERTGRVWSGVEGPGGRSR